MTDSIKHKVKLHGQESAEIEIYFAAATVRDNLGHSLPELHSFLNTLENYVNGAIIQYYRLNDAHKLSAQLLLQRNAVPFNRTLSDSLHLNLHLRFLDLHYYAICVDKIEKLHQKFLKQVALLAKPMKDSDDIRVKRKFAEKQLNMVLSPITEARHYLEHIDREIRKGNFDGLNLETNEAGTKFSYGRGEKRVVVNIEDVEKIKRAYEALVRYIQSLPTSAPTTSSAA